MSSPTSTWAAKAVSGSSRIAPRALSLAPLVTGATIAWSVGSGAAHLIPTLGGIELTTWLFLVLALGGLLARASTGRVGLRLGLRLTGAEWGALTLLLVGVAGVILGPAGGSGIPGLRRMAQHVFVLAAVASLAPSWRSVRLVSAGLICGMSVQVAVGVAELARGATFFYSLWKPLDQATWQGFPRIASTPADPNYFAIGLVATLPLALALRALWPTIPSVIRYGAVMAWLLLLWLTYSRAGYIGLLVLLALRLATGGRSGLRFLLVRARSLRLTPPGIGRRSAAMVLISIPLVAAFSAYGLAPVVGRLVTIGNPTGDASLVMRLSALRAALDVFLDHPALGIGFDRFVEIGPTYLYAIRGVPVPSLNVLDSYLLVACEAGAVGLAGFLFATGWSIHRLLTTSKRLAQAQTPERMEMSRILRTLALGLIAWSVVSLSLDGIHSPTQWVLLGLAALAARCDGEGRSQMLKLNAEAL